MRNEMENAVRAVDQKRISGCSYRHRVTREKEDMSFIVSEITTTGRRHLQ